ncbi:MAG: twin-arginine translocase subunit TatB [Limimaricola sp.]|uniref:Sec-independent protein translocase protein TatB n=1 Tax=Limimaricola sp. TaxID=2211665 RepID=UPI001D36AF3B|nr:Sec-independent protein translocase protein TatB [Limimaricola sp.]MBI1418469.1 twin-arginine translocase subunit TatB [Limimaricola sp.]
MFGMGWSEMVLVGIVALIVIGPKDLPNVFRAMGQFTGKARAMAREFSRAMEAAADESGVRDITKSIQAAANPAKFGLDRLKDQALAPMKPGGETEKLAAEQAANKAKIDGMLAQKAEEAAAKRATAAEKAADAEIIAETAPAKPAAKAPAKPRKAAAPKAAPKTEAKAAKAPAAKAASPKPAKPRAPRKTAPKGDV